MQTVGLGHAWRCHNQLEDAVGNPVEPITMETTISDLIEQNHELIASRKGSSCQPSHLHLGFVAYVFEVDESTETALQQLVEGSGDLRQTGEQLSAQVASDDWRKVLRFGDGLLPPEPPYEHVPGWVTALDPTVTPQRRWGGPHVGKPTPPPGPPPQHQQQQQQQHQRPPPPPPPPVPPKSMPKRPAPKPMPNQERTDYCNASSPLSVGAYHKALYDYSKSPVKSRLNFDHHLQTFAMSHVQGPMGHGVQHLCLDTPTMSKARRFYTRHGSHAVCSKSCRLQAMCLAVHSVQLFNKF
eukprot:s92_g10.t1